MCWKQEEFIQSHENTHVPSIGQSEAQHRIFKRLKLSGGQAYDRSSVSNATRNKNVRHNLLKDALTDRPGI